MLARGRVEQRLRDILLRLAPKKTIGAVADRANNLAPGSHAWLLAGKDRRLSHESCGRPLCTAKATASQQAVACMKHLVEAEKRIFRPKL